MLATADDMGHAHVMVIDDAREGVGRGSIGAQHDHVVGCLVVDAARALPAAGAAACAGRRGSVCSMRSRKIPPSPCSWWWRANSQLNSAVRAPPIWRKPVGEGAKRTTTLMAPYVSVARRLRHPS